MRKHPGAGIKKKQQDTAMQVHGSRIFLAGGSGLRLDLMRRENEMAKTVIFS